MSISCFSDLCVISISICDDDGDDDATMMRSDSCSSRHDDPRDDDRLLDDDSTTRTTIYARSVVFWCRANATTWISSCALTMISSTLWRSSSCCSNATPSCSYSYCACCDAVWPTHVFFSHASAFYFDSCSDSHTIYWHSSHDAPHTSASCSSLAYAAAVDDSNSPLLLLLIRCTCRHPRSEAPFEAADSDADGVDDDDGDDESLAAWATRFCRDRADS